MATGTIKRWTDRGFGFVQPDDGSKELFAHISACRGPDDEQLEILREGDRVSYAVGNSPKGPIAVRVQLIDGEIEGNK